MTLVRKMARADVERVAELEIASFTAPWKADTFEHLLDRPGCHLLVMDDGEAGVVAYAVLWCILDQGELANIAVAGSHRGRGLGRVMMGHVMERARAEGVASLYLEVRVSNASAIGLYRSLGFKDVGFRKRYYDRPVEDALIMVAELG